MNNHIPVLLKETINYLNPEPNKIFIDGTLGGGGHALEILRKTTPHGRLIGIDQDKEALEIAAKRLEKYKERVTLVHDNFRNLKTIVNGLGITRVDGILLDLGLSSYQLESVNRGFSFEGNEKLDMRMDKRQKLTASDIINSYPEEELIKILRELGEEPYATKIAQAIIKARTDKPIHYTEDLTRIIKTTMPPNYRYSKKTHFATSTFRALRMAVNDELGALKDGLEQIPNLLNPKGRIVIISFHSLEDRLVKNFFRYESTDCICPASQPICNCNHQASLKILTKKPAIPQSSELIENPRSRSAKLRATEKIK
jgi:16S rRNA (cytosine1402-N4)-methyltransferase